MVNNRRRGHQFERDIKNILKKVFPKAKRHLEYQEEECLGVDLDNTEPLAIQCKRKRTFSIYKFLDEIKTKGYKTLILKADRKDPLIVFYLKDWIEMVNRGEL